MEKSKIVKSWELKATSQKSFYKKAYVLEDEEGNLDVENLPKKEKLNYGEFMEQSKFFFNDENVSGEDKELFFKSLQEIFLDSLKKTKK